jgi:hypothetical protein
MVFDVTNFILGLLVGVLGTAAITTPRVGRILARTVATLSVGAGIGGLIWATDAIVRGGELAPIGWDRLVISTPSEALGWSGGFLAAGVMALVLSFVGQSSSNDTVERSR